MGNVGIRPMADGELEPVFEPCSNAGGLRLVTLRLVTLRLVTLQPNAGACRFYERHGFVAYARGLRPAPEYEPDVSYRWTGGPG